MSARPLSDRHHLPPTADNQYEIRVWIAAGGTEGWRTVSCSATHDDAVIVASALVGGADAPFAYSEVWGPGRTPDAHRSVTERFPEPTREERQEMWLRAAEENYSTGYSDTKR